MIEEIPEGGSETEIPFPGIPTTQKIGEIVKPNGVNILILPEAPTAPDGLILPQKMKSLEFITARVVAVGPEKKFVKVGDRIIVAAKAIINGDSGIVVDGVKLHFTQENLIIAVVS